MNSGVHFFRPVPSGCVGGRLGSASMESRALVRTRAHGDDSDAEAVLPPVSCPARCCDRTIVHYPSWRQNHRRERRMLEIRLSGPEGGGKTEFNRFSLLLSTFFNSLPDRPPDQNNNFRANWICLLELALWICPKPGDAR